MEKCEKDAYGKHSWVRLGIEYYYGCLNVVWQCEQCKKAKLEKLFFLEDR